MGFSWFVAALALPLTFAVSGCGGCDVGGQTPLEFTDGITNGARTIYETGAPTGDMLHFPPGRTYDLVHGLRARPVTVNSFISFTKRLTPDGDGTDTTKPNHVAESAGNAVVIERWDDEKIRVRNDSCGEFYVRIVALADGAPSSAEGGAGGAP